MVKQLLHITAYSPLKCKSVDLFYYSIKQAKFFNKSMINFKIKGFE